MKTKLPSIDPLKPRISLQKTSQMNVYAADINLILLLYIIYVKKKFKEKTTTTQPTKKS